jgi:hypothetical protein
VSPDGIAQLTGRTMCDRIVVFDAPQRLVGRLVDIDIQAAGAWSLAGDVADGLAEATPLEHLFSGGDAAAAPDVYDIDLTKSVLGRPASSGRPDATASATTPTDATAGA